MRKKIRTSRVQTLLLAFFALAAYGDEKEKIELLSFHDVVATYAGTETKRCMGRTSLCPDRCGHSGKMARFDIQGYLEYRKPGEYGDARQTTKIVMLTSQRGSEDVAGPFAGMITDLKKGDQIRMTWRHNYVTRAGSSFPDRPLDLVKKLTPEEAQTLLEKAAH